MVVLQAKGQETVLVTIPPTSPGSSPLDASPTGMQEQVVINTQIAMCPPESAEQKLLRGSEKHGEQKPKLVQQFQKLAQIQNGVSGVAFDPPPSYCDDIKSFIL